MLVGHSYTLDFTGPFESLSGKQVLLTSIASAKSLIEFGVNVYAEVFEKVGLTRVNYDEWFKGERTIYTFYHQDTIYKVPFGFFTEADPTVTVDYRQHFITIELPYLTEAEAAAVSSNLALFNESLLANHGLEVEAKITPYGLSVAVPSTDSDSTQAERISRKEAAQAARPSVESLQAANAELHVKLTGLEQIIIDKALHN